VLVARSRTKGETAAADISGKTKNRNVDLLLCDLSSQHQVRALASEILKRYSRLHLLVNNAGLILPSRLVTEDGIETTFAVNHLAPFLLTNLVGDRLQESAPARVLAVSSGVHQAGSIDFDDLMGERDYSAWRAYAQSKLANVLFTRELARRWRGTGVTVACLHPGVVRTGFARNGPDSFLFGTWIGRLFLRSPKKGAETPIWLATMGEDEIVNGGYYVKRRLTEPSSVSRDPKIARRLWELSERLTGLSGTDPQSVT
jgi:NAD(P)-dependent dehydrogenase (short-subunit alcohol dehydrogenase family)